MPIISQFYGIIITFYFNEYNPPHFQVQYNENKAEFFIENFAITQGKLPSKAIALVLNGPQFIKRN